jgi:hypothetical protein
MINMQSYWQAATDFRSNTPATRIKGLASLLRLANGPDGISQRQADHLTKEYGVAVMRGMRPDFPNLLVVLPTSLKR